MDIDSKYDTDTDADGEENENPIDSLLTAAQQSRHHHGARGKCGRHLDNETREFIVRLRCDQEAKSNTIQQALADMGKTVNVKTIEPVRRPRMAQYTAEEERYITELQDAHNEWAYDQLRAAWKDKYHRTISDWKIGQVLRASDPPFSEKLLREERTLRATLLQPSRSALRSSVLLTGHPVDPRRSRVPRRDRFQQAHPSAPWPFSGWRQRRAAGQDSGRCAAQHVLRCIVQVGHRAL